MVLFIYKNIEKIILLFIFYIFFEVAQKIFLFI